MGIFGNIFGKKPPASSFDEPPKKRTWYGSVKPQWGKNEETKLNKHWAKNINKRDMLFQEFANLSDWNVNPLIPRALAKLRPEIKDAEDLTKGPNVGLSDYLRIYEKMRTLQDYEAKCKWTFEMIDEDGDGVINEEDLTTFFQSTTGLSDDACRYHARLHFENKGTITYDEFKAVAPRPDLASKIDLPMPQ